MMITTVERRYSLDEYRAIEEKAEGRSEYRDGEIVPMSGGSLNHSRIGGNIFAFLKFILRDSKCEPINSDLRLWIPEYQRGVYPDVMVFADQPQLNDNRNDEVHEDHVAKDHHHQVDQPGQDLEVAVFREIVRIIVPDGLSHSDHEKAYWADSFVVAQIV